jgi:hypothetical protein
MAISTHAPGHPHQHPHEPSMSVADWADAVAVGVALLSVILIVAGILALLFII